MPDFSTWQKKRTAFADILVNAGYQWKKVLRAVDYPAPYAVKIQAIGEDSFTCFASGYSSEELTPNKYFHTQQPIARQKIDSPGHEQMTSTLTILESIVFNDGIEEWYMEASIMDVLYSDGSSRRYAFGVDQKGPPTDPPVPAKHSHRLVEPDNWPVPAFIQQRSTARTQYTQPPA